MATISSCLQTLRIVGPCHGELAGNDTIFAASSLGISAFFGGSGNDSITSDGGEVHGDAGNDTIDAHGGFF